MKLLRLEPGRYITADGQVVIQKFQSRQTGRPTETTWALFINGKLVMDYPTKKEAIEVVRKKLS